MIEQKEAAEADLLAFVRMVWPILEPEVPLVEGWLLDLLCLPYEVEITTDRGAMAIGLFVESGCSARVLSFNHETGLPEWKSVQETKKSQGRPIVNITLCDTVLSVTDDHPVFIVGRGYVRAAEVVPGETVLCVRDVRLNIPPLAGKLEEQEPGIRLLQPVMPLSACAETGSRAQTSELRSVRNCFLAGPQGSEVLQHGVFGEAPAASGYEKMPQVWWDQELGRDSVSSVRHEVPSNRHGKLVRNLWQNLMDNCRKTAEILQSGVLWALEQGRKQLRVHPWRMDKEISHRILANAAENPQTRGKGLLPLSFEEGASHTSHRSECGKQRSVEPCDALSPVPSGSAWPIGEVYTVVESVVCSVERDLRIPKAVYNVAVEGNHNYFAAGVLVHNCDVLMAVTDGHLTRVSINVPPGSSKSSLLNVLWPAFEWGPRNRPSLRYMSISYSTAVPVRDNLRLARLLRHPVYQACWGDRVKLIRDGAEWIGNDKTGFKMVTSTGGGTTGFRGDRLLLDDLNNPIDVESDTVRNTTIKFIREILPDRLNDMKRSAIINLQQRTHQNDATGTLIEYGQDYDFVCIPMEFDPLRICQVVLRRDDDGDPEDVWTDPRSLDVEGNQLDGLSFNARGEPTVRFGSPMAAAEGESCWPERFPEDVIGKLKLEKGVYAWDSQYQQIPGVRGGSIIKREWWKNWSGSDYPELGTVVVSLDTAIELGEQNDWNACTAWGAFAGKDGEPQFLLLSAWRVRAPLAELVRMVAETCRERKADYLFVEWKTRGRDVHDEIARLYQNASWQTELIKPVGDKVSRLKAVSHLFSGDVRKLPDGFDPDGKPLFRMDWFGGVVWAPDKDWADEVISEVASFPYSAHDDYVDTVSQALGWVRKNGVVLRRVEFDDQEYERNKFRKPLSVPYAI